jgi:hypothetical protein
LIRELTVIHTTINFKDIGVICLTKLNDGKKSKTRSVDPFQYFQRFLVQKLVLIQRNIRITVEGGLQGASPNLLRFPSSTFV